MIAQMGQERRTGIYHYITLPLDMLISLDEFKDNNLHIYLFKCKTTSRVCWRHTVSRCLAILYRCTSGSAGTILHLMECCQFALDLLCNAPKSQSPA